MKRTVLLSIFLLPLLGCATVPTGEKGKAPVFYPPPPAKPYIQFLYTISSEDDLGGKQRSGLDDFLFGPTLSTKVLNRPWNISSSKGKIYIVDRGYFKIIIINLAEKKFDFIKDQRLGQLSSPTGIWVTEDDIKFVTDMQRKQVVVFGKDNSYLRAYGSKSLFTKPMDVAVFENSIYVVDMATHKVIVLDKNTGEFTGTVGEAGQGDGQFYRPTHIAIDHTGNIFVNDAFNFRIQKFDRNGKFLKSYGSLGDNPGSFARPKGIDIDREEHLFAADGAFENVQIFDDQTAKLLLFFGGAGTTPGKMYLPLGVHIDYDNVEYFNKYADKDFRLKYVLYVGNMMGPNRLNVYGFGEWVGPSLSGEEDVGVEKESETSKTE